MSFDYTREQQWTITPKGSKCRKPHISSTLHLPEKSNGKRLFKHRDHIIDMFPREEMIELIKKGV
jgi:hypothetical protein